MQDKERKSDSAEVRKLEHDAEQRIHSGESARSAFQHEATNLRHHETKGGHFSKEHYDHELELLKKALKQHEHVDVDVHEHAHKSNTRQDSGVTKADRAFSAAETASYRENIPKVKDAGALEVSNPFLPAEKVGHLEPSRVSDTPTKRPGESEPSVSPGERGQLLVPDKTHKTTVDIWGPSHDALVKKAHSGVPDTAFFGDSITDGMSLSNDFYNLHGKTANFGIHGDTTQNLRYRLEHGELEFKYGKAPKNFVVLVGTNDIGKGKSNEQIARDAAGDAELIARKFPQSKVLVLGLLPRGGLRNEVTDINKYLHDDVSKNHSPNIRFADVGSSMLDKNGAQEAGLWQPDLTHPTYEQGYSRLLPAIKAALENN